MSEATKPAGPSSGPLSVELQGYSDRFAAARTTLAGLTEGITDEQFNWRPGDNNQWSIGECIDHPSVIGTLIMPKLDEGIEKAQSNGWRSGRPVQIRCHRKLVRAHVRPRRRSAETEIQVPENVYTIQQSHHLLPHEQFRCAARRVLLKGCQGQRFRPSSPW